MKAFALLLFSVSAVASGFDPISQPCADVPADAVCGQVVASCFSVCPSDEPCPDEPCHYDSLAVGGFDGEDVSIAPANHLIDLELQSDMASHVCVQGQRLGDTLVVSTACLQKK